MTDGTTGRGGDGIDWPTGLDRTPPDRREATGKFDAGLRDTLEDVERELEDRIGVDDWRLTTAADHQTRNPNYPYADAAPDDPGAVVRWTMDGDRYAVACDRYTELRDNLRALLLYLREKRKMEARPVVTGQSEFATARLPSGVGGPGDGGSAAGGSADGRSAAGGPDGGHPAGGDHDRGGPDDAAADDGDGATTEAAVATEGGPGMTDEEAAALLGLAGPDVSDEVVEVSFEEAVKVEHPDQGGEGNIDRLKRARDQLLE